MLRIYLPRPNVYNSRLKPRWKCASWCKDWWMGCTQFHRQQLKLTGPTHYAGLLRILCHWFDFSKPASLTFSSWMLTVGLANQSIRLLARGSERGQNVTMVQRVLLLTGISEWGNSTLHSEIWQEVNLDFLASMRDETQTRNSNVKLKKKKKVTRATG